MTTCPRCGQPEPPELAKYEEGFTPIARRLVESVEMAGRVARARADAGFPATADRIADQAEWLASIPSGLPAPGAVLPVLPKGSAMDDAEKIGWMIRTGMEMNGWTLAEAVSFVEWTVSVEEDEQ